MITHRKSPEDVPAAFRDSRLTPSRARGRTCTTKTLHADLIAALCRERPEVRTTGFFRELARVGEYMRDILANDPVWRGNVSIVPDAFAIDREGKHVAVFEIVDTHDVDAEKIAKVEEIGWALDRDGYDIAIIRVDRYGRTLIDPVGDALLSVIPGSAAHD